MGKRRRAIDPTTKLVAGNIKLLLEHREWSYGQLALKLSKIQSANSYDPSAISRYLAIADSPRPVFTSIPIALVAGIAKAATVSVDTLFKKQLTANDLDRADDEAALPNYHVVDLLRDDVRDYLAAVTKHENSTENHETWLAFDFPMSSIPSGEVFKEYLSSLGESPRKDSGVEQIHRERQNSRTLIKNILVAERFEWFLKQLSRRTFGSKSKAKAPVAEVYVKHLIKIVEEGRYHLSLVRRRRLFRAGFDDLLRFTAVAVIKGTLLILRTEHNLILWSEQSENVRVYRGRLIDLASFCLPLSVRYREDAQRDHSIATLKQYLGRVQKGEFL